MTAVSRDERRHVKVLAIAIIAVAVLAIAGLVLMHNPERDEVRTLAECGAHIGVVGNAVLKYHGRYGQMPKDFEVLLDMGLLGTPRVLQCPAAPAGRNSYDLRRLNDSATSGRSVLVVENAPRHFGKYWVFYDDGGVELVDNNSEATIEKR
jgi:hypothetical protein